MYTTHTSAHDTHTCMYLFGALVKKASWSTEVRPPAAQHIIHLSDIKLYRIDPHKYEKLYLITPNPILPRNGGIFSHGIASHPPEELGNHGHKWSSWHRSSIALLADGAMYERGTVSAGRLSPSKPHVSESHLFLAAQRTLSPHSGIHLEDPLAFATPPQAKIPISHRCSLSHDAASHARESLVKHTDSIKTMWSLSSLPSEKKRILELPNSNERVSSFQVYSVPHIHIRFHQEIDEVTMWKESSNGWCNKQWCGNMPVWSLTKSAFIPSCLCIRSWKVATDLT